MGVLLDQPLVLFFELGHIAFVDRHNFIMVGFLFTLLLFELPLLFVKVALHLFILLPLLTIGFLEPVYLSFQIIILILRILQLYSLINADRKLQVGRYWDS